MILVSCNDGSLVSVVGAGFLLAGPRALPLCVSLNGPLSTGSSNSSSTGFGACGNREFRSDRKPAFKLAILPARGRPGTTGLGLVTGGMLASLPESVFALEVEIVSFVTFSDKLSEIGFEGRAGICGFGRSETIVGTCRVSMGGYWVGSVDVCA